VAGPLARGGERGHAEPVDDPKADDPNAEPLFQPDPSPAGGRNGKNGEDEPAGPAQDVAQRVMERLQRVAGNLPPGVQPGSVRGIRPAQLKELLEEAVRPEREEFARKEGRLRDRESRLRAELKRLREEKVELLDARDETRRYELPRLAALVDREKSRAEQLEGELDGIERRAAELQAELARSEDARLRQAEETQQLRELVATLSERREREDVVEEEEASHAEELLLALDERLYALEEAERRRDVEGDDNGDGDGDDDDDDASGLSVVLEHFAKAEERAARIAALEEAVWDLADRRGGSSTTGQRRRRELQAAREAERSSQRLMLEALKDQLEQRPAADPRLDELVKALRGTQELLQEEVRRRTEVERSLRALTARLAAVEHERQRLPDTSRWRRQPPASDELVRTVEALVGREHDVEDRIERLGQATRAALERMAQILDHALAAGAAARSGLDEAELERLLGASSFHPRPAPPRRDPELPSREELEPDADDYTGDGGYDGSRTEVDGAPYDPVARAHADAAATGEAAPSYDDVFVGDDTDRWTSAARGAEPAWAAGEDASAPTDDGAYAPAADGAYAPATDAAYTGEAAAAGGAGPEAAYTGEAAAAGGAGAEAAPTAHYSPAADEEYPTGGYGVDGDPAESTGEVPSPEELGHARQAADAFVGNRWEEAAAGPEPTEAVGFQDAPTVVEAPADWLAAESDDEDASGSSEDERAWLADMGLGIDDPDPPTEPTASSSRVAAARARRAEREGRPPERTAGVVREELAEAQRRLEALEGRLEDQLKRSGATEAELDEALGRMPGTGRHRRPKAEPPTDG